MAQEVAGSKPVTHPTSLPSPSRPNPKGSSTAAAQGNVCQQILRGSAKCRSPEYLTAIGTQIHVANGLEAVVTISPQGVARVLVRQVGVPFVASPDMAAPVTTPILDECVLAGAFKQRP